MTTTNDHIDNLNEWAEDFLSPDYSTYQNRSASNAALLLMGYPEKAMGWQWTKPEEHFPAMPTSVENVFKTVQRAILGNNQFLKAAIGLTMANTVKGHWGYVSADYLRSCKETLNGVYATLASVVAVLNPNGLALTQTEHEAWVRTDYGRHPERRDDVGGPSKPVTQVNGPDGEKPAPV